MACGWSSHVVRLVRLGGSTTLNLAHFFFIFPNILFFETTKRLKVDWKKLRLDLSYPGYFFQKYNIYSGLMVN